MWDLRHEVAFCKNGYPVFRSVGAAASATFSLRDSLRRCTIPAIFLRGLFRRIRGLRCERQSNWSVTHFKGMSQQTLSETPALTVHHAAPVFVGQKRYLSDQLHRSPAFLAAAKNYVKRLPTEAAAWLWRKPFDSSPGNPAFFYEMYQVIGLIQAMDMLPPGRVLEIGSGSGWVTEVLVGLGFNVDGIEPSQDMIDVAQERVAAFISLRRILNPPVVQFHCTTLEDCNLVDESFDGILFHEALHHIVDEEKALAQCYRLLRPGGVVGIDEAAWVPGLSQGLEERLEREMLRYGTLENPFTVKYLDYLLQHNGFTDITRYHGIYRLVPAESGDEKLRKVADAPAETHNNLTARKPSLDVDTRDPDAKTLAGIVVTVSMLDAKSQKLSVSATLTNTGETRWLSRRRRSGYVTIAMRQYEPGTPGFVEAGERHRLPKDLAPGESIDVELAFDLPANSSRSPWFLDLVNEGLFWFSKRGTQAAAIRL